MAIWTYGLRGVGVCLALMMALLIIRKMRSYYDPALWWLLGGLSIGPACLIVWNFIFRAFVSDYILPTDRIASLGHIQVRFAYEILNNVLNLSCATAALIGVARLYLHVERRYRPVPPEEFDTGDPRN